MVRYSFVVGLLPPRLSAGLSRRFLTVPFGPSEQRRDPGALEPRRQGAFLRTRSYTLGGLSLDGRRVCARFTNSIVRASRAAKTGPASSGLRCFSGRAEVHFFRVRGHTTIPRRLSRRSASSKTGSRSSKASGTKFLETSYIGAWSPITVEISGSHEVPLVRAGRDTISSIANRLGGRLLGEKICLMDGSVVRDTNRQQGRIGPS